MNTQEQTPCCNGIGVMYGTAKDMLAEKDAEIAELRADLECKEGRIRNLHDEMESLHAVIKTKNRLIDGLQAVVNEYQLEKAA